MKSPEPRPLKSFFIAIAWWVCSVLIFSVLYWMTLPLEQRATARIVNAAFETAGDVRRVAAPIPSWGSNGVASLSGTRFSIKGKDEIAVVFSVAGGGSSASFVAVYMPKKGIQAVLPLDVDSKAAVTRLPAGLFETYVAHIASSEALAAKRKAEK
ncbi:MAG: hypothetical protein WCT14_13665 [Treponemataceae bacterium]